MTAKECYKRIPKSPKEHLVECTDFGDFYGFVFSETDEAFGGAYRCMKEDGGDVFMFNPTDDFELFDKGKMLDLSDIK